MLQIYRNGANGQIIRGQGLSAFIHNNNYYETIIGVFEDGMIDCWGLVNFEEFKTKVAQGWVVTEVPKGAMISCHHLYWGNSTLEFYIEIDEFVKEVEDIINLLQGKQTVAESCIQAFARFLTLQKKENKSSLRVAYNAIPKHLRIYVLGDMDCKDSAILACIDEDIEVSQEIIESCKTDYDWIWERLN
ncbi:hypothetical protein [Tychonema sp. BBK16]|uniref:DUF7638 domain-containing protein n=1 Tax=Tychonema sp. BBK16 TaxID=2699888 RepID=UPI001F384D34|nr:hypothetical protein [Tychonema sp. BBK16]MCF6372793.1 hypothetical protein [Tychonema sp. BBK16]